MKMKKMKLLNLKLDKKNNFVFEARYVDNQYVFETYYETNCNIKTVFKKSIIEVLDTYKIPYTKKDIHNYVERMMISNIDGEPLANYFAKRIKGVLIEYLKFTNIIIDKKKTFYVDIFTTFINQMFKDFAVQTLKLLDLELIDYYVVMLDNVVKVDKDGDITIRYRYDKNLSKIDNMKWAIIKSKDEETTEMLKKGLKRAIEKEKNKSNKYKSKKDVSVYDTANKMN